MKLNDPAWHAIHAVVSALRWELWQDEQVPEHRIPMARLDLSPTLQPERPR